MIKHEGKHWVLYSLDGKRKLGTHDTEADALSQEKAIQQKVRHAEQRSLHLLGATGQVRTEMDGNKEHLVVPVVMLMEGVIHAVNAETPEFVPFETLQQAAESWNGRPVTLGHPKRNGVQCSADDPGVWDAHGIGIIRNSHTDAASKKMLAEALIETARAKKLHPDMYQRLAEGGTEEVSVGAMVVSDHKTGKHGAKPFIGSWTYAKGDHLAFLPGGRGACSVEMGCGTHRAAMKFCEGGLELEVLRDISQSERDEMAKSDFAGPDESFPIKTQADVEAASHLVGKAKDPAAVKARIIEIAKRKGLKLPDTWVKAAQRSPSCLTFTTLEDMSLNDRINHVQNAVNAKWNDPQPTPPDAWAYASQVFDDFTIVVNGDETLKVPYEVSDNGEVTLGKPVAVKQQWVAASDAGELTILAGARHSAKDTSLIQAMHDHTMALGATCDRSNYKLMERNITEGDTKMKPSKLNDPTRFYIERVKTGTR